MATRTVLLEWAVTGARPFPSAAWLPRPGQMGERMDDSPNVRRRHLQSKTYTMELDDVGLTLCMPWMPNVWPKSPPFSATRMTTDVSWLSTTELKASCGSSFGTSRMAFSRTGIGMAVSRETLTTNFYPLVAGIATTEQAKRMVREH